MGTMKIIDTADEVRGVFTAEALYRHVYEPLGLLNTRPRPLYAAFFETSILNGGVKNYVLVAKDALDHLVGAMTAPDAAQEFARRSNVRSAVAVNATRAGIQRQLPVFRAAVALTQRENNHTGWIFNDAASAHLMDGIENAYARKMKGRRFNRAERDMPLIPGAYVPAVLRPAA